MIGMGDMYVEGAGVERGDDVKAARSGTRRRRR